MKNPILLSKIAQLIQNILQLICTLIHNTLHLKNITHLLAFIKLPCFSFCIYWILLFLLVYLLYHPKHFTTFRQYFFQSLGQITWKHIAWLTNTTFILVYAGVLIRKLFNSTLIIFHFFNFILLYQQVPTSKTPIMVWLEKESQEGNTGMHWK